MSRIFCYFALFGLRNCKGALQFSSIKIGLRNCKGALQFSSIKIRVRKCSGGEHFFSIIFYKSLLQGFWECAGEILWSKSRRQVGVFFDYSVIKICVQNLADKLPHLLFDSPLIKRFRQPDGCVCSVF